MYISESDLKKIIFKITEAHDESTRTEETQFDELNNIISNIKNTYKVESYNSEKRFLYLEKRIKDIKQTNIESWKEQNLGKIKEIVEKINLEKGVILPILSICGHGTQEIRFTKYLAYFLDSSKNHGLGKKLLEKMIEDFDIKINLDDGYEVFSEYYLGSIKSKNKNIGNIVDISIFGKNFIILIEQKILSQESIHPDSDLSQLERYSFILESNADYRNRDILKIYLTPNTQNKNSKGWESISHVSIIEKGLEILKEQILPRHAKENLTRFLLDLATGPYEKSEEDLNKLIDLAKKILNEGFYLGNIYKYNRLLSEYKYVVEVLMMA